MKKKYKIISSAIIIVFICLAAAFWMLTPQEVSLETVMPEDLINQFFAQGITVPSETLLISASRSGLIEHIPYSIGSVIEPGCPIMIVDDSLECRQLEDQITSLKLQQSMLQSEQLIKKEQLVQQLNSSKLDYDRLYGTGGAAAASLNSSIAAYDLASKEYENGTVLRENGFISEQDLGVLYQTFTQAKQALSTAKSADSISSREYYKGLIQSYETQLAALESTQSGATEELSAGAEQLSLTIASLKEKLQKPLPSAPYVGVVLDVFVRPGEYVTEKQALMAIYPKDQLKIQVELLADETSGLTPDTTALCQLSNGNTFEATISFISSVARKTVSSVGLAESRSMVELTSTMLPSTVGSGYPIDITFTSVAARQTLAVALSAVVPVGKEDGVYVVRGGKAKLVTVKTGLKYGGKVQIVEGLETGDKVITDPYHDKIKEGMRIK